MQTRVKNIHKLNSFIPSSPLVVIKNLKQILLFFLLLSCSRSPEINTEQEEKITAFFEELLLEHGGAYTLFGSKPITVESLIDYSGGAFQEMQNYLKTHPETESISVERNLEEGWIEWKKQGQKYPSKNYILTEIQFDHHALVIFVNIKETASVISKNYEEFKRVLKHDFDVSDLILQLRQGKKDSWKQILSDFALKGILFGYGHQNATLFEMHAKEQITGAGPSENNDPRIPAECYLNNKPFRIPIFVMLDINQSTLLVDKYKQERERIKNSYLGKDFLTVTLSQFTSTTD